MSLTTFTVTGTPSFIRSSGPGEVPLYPTVLIMRLGANSTVTGAICSVKSVLATSCEPAGARKEWCSWPTSGLLAAANPAILRKSRLCIRNAKSRPPTMVTPASPRAKRAGGLTARIVEHPAFPTKNISLDKISH